MQPVDARESLLIDEAANLREWDRRATQNGLHAVLSTRWSVAQTAEVDRIQNGVMQRMLPDVAARLVLDVGCGIGRLAWPLADRGAHVVGVDKSRVMLCRAIAERQGRPVRFVRGSANALPFPDGAFDIVNASYVLQHILDDQVFHVALREIARVTRSGGLVLTLDGLAERRFIPNSMVTIVRTVSDYQRVIRSVLTSIRSERIRCIDDDYTALLWQRA